MECVVWRFLRVIIPAIMLGAYPSITACPTNDGRGEYYHPAFPCVIMVAEPYQYVLEEAGGDVRKELIVKQSKTPDKE